MHIGSASLTLCAVLVSLPTLVICCAQSDKSPTEIVQQRIDEGALVVDVRTPEEYAEWHFEGAVNINVAELEQRLNEFGPRGKPVVVYCRSGRRSGIAKDKLEAAGYTDVVNAGGLDDVKHLKR